MSLYGAYNACVGGERKWINLQVIISIIPPLLGLPGASHGHLLDRYLLSSYCVAGTGQRQGLGSRVCTRQTRPLPFPSASSLAWETSSPELTFTQVEGVCRTVTHHPITSLPTAMRPGRTEMQAQGGGWAWAVRERLSEGVTSKLELCRVRRSPPCAERRTPFPAEGTACAEAPRRGKGQLGRSVVLEDARELGGAERAVDVSGFYSKGRREPLKASEKGLT